MKKKNFATIDFSIYEESIPHALNLIEADKILSEQTAVLIKPNLINASPFPVTTPAECCRSVIEYVRAHSKAEIVVAEGCGDVSHETGEIFDILGYNQLSKQYEIRLVDLNHEPLIRLENDQCTFFPEMYLPKIAFSHFVISLPVLKAHSLATITGTLKNMMGFAPPKYYSGGYGIWKKSLFHSNMHQSIKELNRYRSPDLSLIDASVGLADYHLGGDICSPPVNKIITGYDPVAVDREAASLLNFNWKDIPHLQVEL